MDNDCFKYYTKRYYIKYIDEQISHEKNKDTINMLESGKELFSKYLDGSASEGWVALKVCALDTPEA